MIEASVASPPDELAGQLQPGMRLEATYGERVVSFTVGVVGMRWIGKRNGGTEQYPDSRFAILTQDLLDGEVMSVSRSLQELLDHDVRVVPAAG